MTKTEFFSNPYIVFLLGIVGGVITTWITTRILNKRSTFSYSVTHNKIGVSATDPIFGDIAVTWNGSPASNLYLSTLELKNESLRDYENVILATTTANTNLLSESTRIADTPFTILWSEDYKARLHVEPGQSAADDQLRLYYAGREYLLPVFNRGQVVTISYLNSAHSDSIGPSIWLSGNIKGAKIKFREPNQEFFGVSAIHGTIVGLVSVLIVLFPIVSLSNKWLIASVGLTYGFLAPVTGILMIKAFRFVRQAIGG